MRSSVQEANEAESASLVLTVRDRKRRTADVLSGSEVDVSRHSTVTLFARFLGLSTSVPRATAVWYASSCSGTTLRIGDSTP